MPTDAKKIGYHPEAPGKQKGELANNCSRRESRPQELRLPRGGSQDIKGKRNATKQLG